MTISDDSGLQDDQRDRSADVIHSTVMDSKEENDDVLQSLFARHSHDMGHDRFRSSCEVEKVQEVEVAECEYTCDQVNGESCSAKLLCECDVCHQTFNDSTCLSRHKRSQSCFQLYVCEICNKAFATNCYLQVHKRIHTGEKPYNCDVLYRVRQNKVAP